MAVLIAVTKEVDDRIVDWKVPPSFFFPHWHPCDRPARHGDAHGGDDVDAYQTAELEDERVWQPFAAKV